MKKILLIIAILIMGTGVTQALGQINVRVGSPYVIQPPAYNVGVNVPQYYRVQPQPYLVTPQVKLPPPKPLFWTPVRNFLWRSAHPARIHYHVQPVPQQQIQFYKQQPYRPN